MDRVESMCLLVLVGLIEYSKLNEEELTAWLAKHCKPLINCVPSVSLLANGWMVLILWKTTMVHRLWMVFGLLGMDP